MRVARPGELPGAVLFACTMNAIRSPMAAAILRHLAARRCYVMSAGVRAGRFDPMTPWPYARDVARTLPNALRVVVADAGHSTLSDFNACQTRLAVDFLDELQAARADACRTAPGPVFATDMDAILAPAAAR